MSPRLAADRHRGRQQLRADLGHRQRRHGRPLRCRGGPAHRLAHRSPAPRQADEASPGRSAVRAPTPVHRRQQRRQQPGRQPRSHHSRGGFANRGHFCHDRAGTAGWAPRGVFGDGPRHSGTQPGGASTAAVGRRQCPASCNPHRVVVIITRRHLAHTGVIGRPSPRSGIVMSSLLSPRIRAGSHANVALRHRVTPSSRSELRSRARRGKQSRLHRSFGTLRSVAICAVDHPR